MCMCMCKIGLQCGICICVSGCTQKECCDADEAFNLWLQRKKQQQLKEQQLEEMKRLEMESSSYMHQPEESAKAFRL